MNGYVATDQESAHMQRALELAARGRGVVSPNPMVGAVIVDAAGNVVGEGFHERAGDRHAEAAALSDAAERGADVTGATMHVTLEPCAHQGRQPPCTDAILASGVSRVVIASDDPTPKASGRGPDLLTEAGIEVSWAGDAAAERARLLNQAFRKHALTGKPLVALKSAVTLDGRTATADGDSKWISGDQSRELVHRWRSDLDAVAIGIDTALTDDAMLTARGVGAPRQPARVVFDSTARLPLDGKLVRTATEATVIVIAGPQAPRANVDGLTNAGVEVVRCRENGPEGITAALLELGRRDVTSVLLEGGATLAGAFRDADELDELRLFIAPLLLGGAEARPIIGGIGAPRLRDAERALDVRWRQVGDDMLACVRMKEW